MDDEGVAIGIIALVLALGGLGLVLSLPAGMSSAGLLFTNGTRPLTANWNVGSFNITANTFFGNFNGTISNAVDSDLLDGEHGSYYLDWNNFDNIPSVWDASQIPTLTLSTSNITSGTFALSYVPRLDLTKIPFGTSGNLSTLVGFTVTSRSDALNAHQGVAFDGTYYYTTKSPVGTGDYIYKYNTTFSLIDNRDVSGDLPVGFTQINSMYYKDGLLYVGCSNVAVTPKEGYIIVFNIVDLSLNATHTVKALWTEGCAFYNNSWWVTYDGGDESKIVSKYDTSWSWVADYDLTFSQEEKYETTIKGYQGIRWVGDYLFVNSHENLIPATLDVYKWNGAGFDKITRAAQPSLWASQSFDVNVDGSVWYFAERYYSGNTSDYRIIIATPIEQGYFLEGFDDPTDSIYNILSASDMPTLDASKIITGVFDLSRIPVMNDAHIPNLETLSYGGAFAVTQIPSLDASKIITGQFATSRIPTLTLSASNISSGTFGNSRLDLSALAQNIAFTSTQTVDGIDLSALLLKTTKVTDLGSIWDKTTKIAYGDTDFANQALLQASSPTFNHIHSSAIDSVLTGSGAIYSGTPTLLLEDTSNRATLVMSSTTDMPLDINFKVNGATRWDISSRANNNNYDLIFYRWKTITPCIILSYDTGLVTFESGITVSGQITGYYMSGDYGLTWTQSMPSGVNGMMVTVYNSNAGILSSRWYVYSNSGWHWSALT